MVEQRSIAVAGMTCVGCEHALRRALERLDGVEAASADHRTGRVEVTFAPERVDPADLEERIRTAGYEVAATSEG